jgi:hypothetical protein
MNYIILLLFSIIFPISCFNSVKPKLCINCKYFKLNNKDTKFGQCSFFPKEEGKINFLVNGINEELYYYCSTARQSNDMCGPEGQYFKKKIIKKNDKNDYINDYINNKYINSNSK